MMKKFLTLFLTVVLFQIFQFPAAAEVLPDVAELKKQYPDANTVLLKNEEYIRYNPDGSYLTTDEYSFRILTVKGRDDMRKLNFHFHTGYEKLAVRSLSVTKNDGRTITLDPAKLSVVSIDHSQISMRIYDPASKQLSLTIPDLEIGDIVNISVKEECFKSRIPGQWSGFAVLQSDCPVLDYHYTIDAPATRPLRSIAVKDEVKGHLSFSKTSKDGRIIYSWHAKNVPQLIPEPGMPPLYRCAMRVLTSTAKDWSEIASWYADLCAPRLAAVTPEMKAFVQKTVSGKSNDMEKITALFQYVSQRVRYTGITDEETAPGYEPHDVSRTFERGHGVCRDKAALLVSLLKLAGFEANPVLFMSGYPKDEDVPNIYFNHAIVQVKGKDGRDILMDPTFETTTDLLPAYLGNCSYLVATGKPITLKRSPVIPAENNLLTIETKAEIKGGTLSGESVLDFKGIHDQMYRSTFSEWQPEEIRRYFAGALRDVLPGAELKKCTVTPTNIRNMAQPLKVVLKYSVPQYLSGSGKILLPLPELSSRLGTISNLYNALKLEKRRFPLEALPRAVSEKFSVKLPAALCITALPETAAFSLPGVLRLNRSIRQKDNIISGENFFAIDTAEFSPQEYTAIKAALAGFDLRSKLMPLAELQAETENKEFRASDYPGADSLVISDIRKVNVISENSWEDTRTISRKVFTYAGAVQHSTVNIPYHPLMEELSISGEFITPDGKRHTLSPAEINRLDAPWATAAKRYPAGKILTAAFPGVAPGTVITYTVKRKVRNRSFFYLSMPAKTAEPTLFKQLELHSEIPFYNTLPPLFDIKRERVKKVTATICNQDRLIAEAFTPEPDLYVPTFKVYSKAAPEFVDKLLAALKAKITVTPEIRALARKLGSINAIHKFVTENIMEAGPALNEAPWSTFSTPEETLKSGVGNSADRAILYAALCEASGIKYQFLAVADVPHMKEPQIHFRDYSKFSRIILRTEGGFFLNDSGRYAAPVDLHSFNKVTLDLNSGELLERKLIPICNDRHRVIEIKINTDRSADISVVEDHFGLYGQALARKLATSSPEELKQFFQSRCAAFSQAAQLKSFNAKKSSIKYNFVIPEFTVKWDKFHSFELPGFRQYAQLTRLSGEPRRYPYQRREPENLSTLYKIRLPENLQLVDTALKMPLIQNFSESIPAQETSLTYFVKRLPKTSEFYINVDLYLPFETIPPDQYPRLFELNKLLNTPALRQVILMERSK